MDAPERQLTVVNIPPAVVTEVSIHADTPDKKTEVLFPNFHPADNMTISVYGGTLKKLFFSKPTGTTTLVYGAILELFVRLLAKGGVRP